MKFYNREQELKILHQARIQSQERSKMTIITGRRRIGKTRLITESLKGETYLYFFVARKAENLLCQEFTQQMRDVDIPIFGTISQFKDLFNILMNIAKEQPLTLVIDEFQEFLRINPAIYSDMQNIWDQQKESTKMNLILSGSVYSLMSKIFEDSKEPLFGRADEKILLQPFSAKVQREILFDFYPNFSASDLLAFYMFTGGVPKYLEQFVDKRALTQSQMLEEMLRDNSLFLEEGKNVLIEEFGKEYTIYFSILSLMASSRTSRSEIESMLKRDIGGYLTRLEEDYQIIRKHRPILSKPGSRNIKYRINDNFLNFWFRFIYKNRGAIEIKNFPYIRKIIDRDLSTFSGHFLEKFFKEELASSLEFSQIGSYWERGNRNEIDIVALNELEKKALIAEIKVQKKNISIPKLQAKSYGLLKKLSGYKVEYKGFSLEDVKGA